jgi:hypothetical protein
MRKTSAMTMTTRTPSHNTNPLSLSLRGSYSGRA